MISKPVILAVCALAAVTAAAQSISNTALRKAAPQMLQQQYGTQVHAANERVAALQFPYPFYLSTALGVEERKQHLMAPGSVRFDLFQERTVVAISGNYYASYSAQLLTPAQRARQTFQDVMLPLLKAAVPEFGPETPFQAFALEIAHHVRGKMMGVSSENHENVVLVIPRSAALRLVAATDRDAQQAALLDSEAFVNGEPITVWLGDGEAPPPQPHARFAEATVAAAAPAARVAPVAPAAPLHDPSKQNLAALQNAYQEKLSKLAAELGTANHFVSYAPPAFIAFRKGSYLQLSLNTDLGPSGGGSQYRQAALAFDQHVAHLVRSVLALLPEQPDFDGIDFSTTVSGVSSPVAVEFIVPSQVLRCYENYDCTGQQLIDSGFVLINGERVSLDLQSAEAENKR